MRVSQWIGIALPVAGCAFGLTIFLSGAKTESAGESPALPPASAPIDDTGGSAAPASSLERELSAPEQREAASYPWEDFESIIGRDLTVAERDALRALREEHGLRLAEQHARVQRGELGRAEFDAWRAARAAEFRGDIAQMLGCSAEQVTALLRVPTRTAAVP